MATFHSRAIACGIGTVIEGGEVLYSYKDLNRAIGYARDHKYPNLRGSGPDRDMVPVSDILDILTRAKAPRGYEFLQALDPARITSVYVRNIYSAGGVYFRRSIDYALYSTPKITQVQRQSAAVLIKTQYPYLLEAIMTKIFGSKRNEWDSYDLDDGDIAALKHLSETLDETSPQDLERNVKAIMNI